jgi:antitoxin MazE
MRTPVRRFGNSQGIIIPKGVLSLLQIEDEVDLEVVDGRIELRPVTGRRAGWAEEFAALPPEALELSGEGEDFLSFDLNA